MPGEIPLGLQPHELAEQERRRALQMAVNVNYVQQIETLPPSGQETAATALPADVVEQIPVTDAHKGDIGQKLRDMNGELPRCLRDLGATGLELADVILNPEKHADRGPTMAELRAAKKAQKNIQAKNSGDTQKPTKISTPTPDPKLNRKQPPATTTVPKISPEQRSYQAAKTTTEPVNKSGKLEKQLLAEAKVDLEIAAKQAVATNQTAHNAISSWQKNGFEAQTAEQKQAVLRPLAVAEKSFGQKKQAKADAARSISLIKKQPHAPTTKPAPVEANPAIVIAKPASQPKIDVLQPARAETIAKNTPLVNDFIEARLASIPEDQETRDDEDDSDDDFSGSSGSGDTWDLKLSPDAVEPALALVATELGSFDNAITTVEQTQTELLAQHDKAADLLSCLAAEFDDDNPLQLQDVEAEQIGEGVIQTPNDSETVGPESALPEVMSVKTATEQLQSSNYVLLKERIILLEPAARQYTKLTLEAIVTAVAKLPETSRNIAASPEAKTIMTLEDELIELYLQLFTGLQLEPDVEKIKSFVHKLASTDVAQSQDTIVSDLTSDKQGTHERKLFAAMSSSQVTHHKRRGLLTTALGKFSIQQLASKLLPDYAL